MSLKDFLRETLGLGKEDVFRVDTKDSFSFFNTEANLTPLVLETFKDFKLEGRRINVEVSKKPERRGKSRKRDWKKGRKSEGFSSNSKSNSKGRKRKKGRNSGFF